MFVEIASTWINTQHIVRIGAAKRGSLPYVVVLLSTGEEMVIGDFPSDKEARECAAAAIMQVRKVAESVPEMLQEIKRELTMLNHHYVVTNR